MRRIVIAWLFWACATVVVRSQEPANKTPVIGWLSPATTQSYHQAGADQPGPQLLRDSLARHGLVDGKNIRIDMRLAEGKLERLPALAQAMVREGANVILAFGEPAAQAALIATKTIPIVAVGDDLVGSGLAATLAKPGGNVTGVSILATELDAKKIEVLKELLPDSKRLGVLNDPATSGPDRAQSIADTARLLGVDLQVIDITGADDLEHAFAAFRAGGVEGVNVVSSAMLTGLRLRLGQLSLAARIPTICQFRFMAETGCLASYGIRPADFYALAADQIARVLKGAKPAEMPIEQPTKFELVINLNTARALGVAISPTLLARAAEVIE